MTRRMSRQTARRVSLQMTRPMARKILRQIPCQIFKNENISSKKLFFVICLIELCAITRDRDTMKNDRYNVIGEIPKLAASVEYI